MNNPLISIIIPLYNNEKYIAECLLSCINQTYRNIEIVIVDDGSTDDSVNCAQSVLSNWEGKYKIIQQTNSGASRARNRGIEESQGDYILFLDSDDILDNRKIESHINQLGQYHFDPELLSFGACIGLESSLNLIDERLCDVALSPVDLLTTMFQMHLCIYVHCFVTSRELILKSGYWNENLCVDDDGEFFARVILKSRKISYCEEAICYYRQGTPNSISKGLSKRSIDSLVAATLSKSEQILSSEDSQRTRKAVIELCTYKFDFYYPYYSQQRRKVEKYLNEKLPEYKIIHPKRDWKSMLYYYLVCLGVKKSQYLK